METMAKAEQTNESTPELNDNDLAVARQVIQDITGCGIIEATERLKSIDVKQLLVLEKEGQRAKIVCMLY